jgi:hypothetical protein
MSVTKYSIKWKKERLRMPSFSNEKMRNEPLYIFTFCVLASIFIAGIFLFNSSEIQIVEVGDFLRPSNCSSKEELVEVDDLRDAAKPISLEINGEKHLGILSVDFFSFSDALLFCESKALKMPSGTSLRTTTTDAHGYGGNKNNFDCETIAQKDNRETRIANGNCLFNATVSLHN